MRANGSEMVGFYEGERHLPYNTFEVQGPDTLLDASEIGDGRFRILKWW
jgi:hypothetical protein